MSTMPAQPALDVRRPRTATSLGALYRLLLRTQVTIPRLAGIVGLSALSVVLGALALWDDEPLQTLAEGITVYGLTLLVPLTTLWLGSAAIGDLVEDRLLVYVWLKPVSRWQLPAAAVAATFTVVAPITALAQVIAPLAAGELELAVTSAAAVALATLAYSALFVAVGLWFRRAVWIGLAFVLLWESVGSRLSDGTARFTVAEWSQSIVAATEGVDLSAASLSATTAFVVLPAVAVAGWLAAWYRYRAADVD